MFTNNSGGFFQPDNNQFQGGGMFNDQNTQGGNNGGNKFDNNGPKKARLYVPMTLKMVADVGTGPDDQCQLDGNNVDQVIVVGALFDQHKENMRTIFEIDDTTGQQKIIFYQKGENEVPSQLRDFEYSEGAWVKIFGTIRVFKDEKALIGSHIQVIQKQDLVTNHFLQTMVAHQIRTKGVLNKADLKQQVGGNQMISRPAAGADFTAKVMNLMRETTKNQRFTHRNDLWAILQNQMTNGDFQNALNQLQEEGAIYTTVDNDCFSITE